MIPDKNEWIKALEERHGKELQNKNGILIAGNTTKESNKGE